MRAIGYYRLVNGNGHLTAGQMNEGFKDYCERYVHQPVGTFGDTAMDTLVRNGDGGWESNGGFAEYQRMLNYIKGSQSNFLVVVPDSTHLGEHLEGVVRSVLEIEATGCKVTCDDDHMPDPLQNALDSVGVSGVSKTHSERIKKSMQERAILGKGLGKAAYGYKNGSDGTLEVVEDEAQVVRLIYDKYVRDKLGLRLIAQYLNEQGLTTRRGGRWNMVTIRDILRNPTYMGTYTRFGLRLPRSHEAIVSSQMFRAVQDQTRERKPPGRSAKAEPFLLSGLVFCGYCDNKMMGVTRRQTWKRKDGRSTHGVYRYYQCQTRNNQSLCGYHTWRAAELEDAVLSQLAQGVEVRASDDAGHLGTQRDRLQSIWDVRVKNAERRFVLNLKRAARGEFGIRALVEHLDELDRARRGAANPPDQMDVGDTLAKWDGLDFAERQVFLMTHITKVVVWDESVVDVKV